MTDAKISVTVQFLLCVILNLRAVSKYKPPGGLYLEGQFNIGFFALRVSGAYTWRAYFQNFTVSVVIGQEPVAGNQRNLVIS